MPRIGLATRCVFQCLLPVSLGLTVFTLGRIVRGNENQADQVANVVQATPIGELL